MFQFTSKYHALKLLTRSLSLPRRRPTDVASASSTAEKNLTRSSSSMRDMGDAFDDDCAAAAVDAAADDDSDD